MATTTPQTTSSSRRRTFIQVFTSPRDRLAYLWLVLAMVLMPFTIFRWTIPLAAWLVPIFLLRFVRTQPLLRGILLVLLATVLVLVFALQGVLALPGALYYLLVFGGGVILTLPYLIDRVIAPRLRGLLATLVFPSAMTTIWYLNDLLNPSNATWFNPAYTQYGNLPLLQLLSVTGLWGIVFLMSWLASVVNWAWERGFAWPRVRAGLLLYSVLLALVFVGGGVRLAFFAPIASTVRVVGITAQRSVYPARVGTTFLPFPSMDLLLHGKATEANRQAIRPVFARLDEDLLTRSQQEARAGAKIILWPEVGALVLQEDEAAFLQQARVVAQASGIYLDMGLLVFTQEPPFAQNKTILVDPAGKVLWHFYKAHPGPGEPWLAGDGKVPTVQTPYGRLSNVICYDMNFPSTIRQAGQAGADVMLVPGDDWSEIDPMHTQIATFRAIENGFSEVRQASNGLAMAVDYEGHVLATSDYFTTDPQVMVAYVPMQGVRTIYATIGDLFAWLSLAGLVVLIGVALARRRTAGEVGAAAPITASPSSGEPSEASLIEARPTEAMLTEPRPPSRELIEAVLITPSPSSGEPPAAKPS